MMKVVLVHSENTGTGGGVMQMQRLHAGLRRKGIDSRILCLKRREPSDDSFGLEKSPVVQRAERFIHRFTRAAGLNDLHRVSSFGVKDLPQVIDADVIDLHAIHYGTFNYLALPGLSARKPVVFTMHDMWAITGHCHASWGCDRWKTGCGKCPHPEIQPAVRRDTTRIEWRLKRYAYDRSRLTLVCGNRWLERHVEESLLKGHPVARVPWGIDTDVYRPLGRAACRQMLGIPPGKKVLLFGVADFRIFLKGGDLFREALGRLPQSVKKDLMLLLFGNGGRAFAQSEDVGVMDLGYISSDPLKAIAYSSADLLVHPTRADNSPCTVIESLACGTPVVSFRVGGVPELVRPGETGWLAPPEDAAGLARAITEALEDDLRRFRVGERSREFAVSEHSLDAYAENYLAVYRRAVERFHGRKAPVRDPDGSRVDEPVTERVH